MRIHRASTLAHTAAAVCALLGTACRNDHSARTAAGPVLDSLPTPPPPALSRFNLPLRYDFVPVLGVVERVVPRTFGSIDEVHQVGDDDHKHYAYGATRGPFTAFANGRLVHLRATLSYQARGFYKPPIGPTLSAGCGDSGEQPRVTVELVTPLSLTSDWHLTSHASVGRLQPASRGDRDRCTVSIIHYDVTDRVVDAARAALTSHLADIDRKVAQVDLTDHVTEWWALLNKPIHLADSVWLVLDPVRLRMGSVSGDGTTLVVLTGLDAHPRIVTGNEPHITPPPLPPLARDTVSDGFHVLLEGVVDYATASHAITSALENKPITQAGHTVTVRAVRVTPLPRGRLALAVDFTGDANGTLAFVGTPRYERSQQQITVPDLDYDLSTDSKLITAYAWLESDALRTLFRDKARVPVRPLLDRGRELLLDGLNRKLGDAVTLSATVDSVAVAGLYVTRAGVVVRAQAAGHAGMAVQQR